MKKNILVVVDMQNDFIFKDCALGSDEAEKVFEDMISYLQNIDTETYVIFTRDTHYKDYLTTQEGIKLPVEHCIKNTAGWAIPDRLTDVFLNSPVVIDKPTFGSVELMEFIDSIVDNEADTNIEFVGLCTDICVISNAIMAKAYFPEANISVNSNLCAGTSIEAHDNALKAMHQCQINII